MTYGRVHIAGIFRNGKGADVSHLAELVRGNFRDGVVSKTRFQRDEGPLIRSVSPKASHRAGGASTTRRLDGPPSPQGEKGLRPAQERPPGPACIHVAET